MPKSSETERAYEADQKVVTKDEEIENKDMKDGNESGAKFETELWRESARRSVELRAGARRSRTRRKVVDNYIV